MQKCLTNKANNSKVTNWLSDIQIEIDKCVMTIYEYDGFKISIDTKPKQIKTKEKSRNISHDEELKTNNIKAMISDVNYIGKSKTPNQIKRLVFDSLIESNPKSYLFWNEESDEKYDNESYLDKTDETYDKVCGLLSRT